MERRGPLMHRQGLDILGANVSGLGVSCGTAPLTHSNNIPEDLLS